MALTVCKTAASVYLYSYHLREIPPEGRQCGAVANGKALCGVPIGWDVLFPLENWGRPSHVPYKYCSKCTELAAALIPGDVVRASGDAICSSCNGEYRRHPAAFLDKDGHPYLTRLCNGEVVKL